MSENAKISLSKAKLTRPNNFAEIKCYGSYKVKLGPNLNPKHLHVKLFDTG